MTTLKKSSGLCVLLALLVVAAPLYGFSSTCDYSLKNSTRPGYLQSLISPKDNEKDLTWLGADAATSVEITPSRYVWLFGNTILGKKDGSIRKYSVFIHNTIGVMERSQRGDFSHIEKIRKKPRKTGLRGSVFAEGGKNHPGKRVS